MVNPILQTVLVILNIFLAFCNACIMIYVFKSFLTRPHDTLEERLVLVENKVKDIDISLLRGNDRFRKQDDTNEVLIRSVSALIQFEIQYCLTEDKEMSSGLEEAKSELDRYLAKRG